MPLALYGLVLLDLNSAIRIPKSEIPFSPHHPISVSPHLGFYREWANLFRDYTPLLTLFCRCMFASLTPNPPDPKSPRSTFVSNPLLEGFIAAGREHITQAASLLLGTHPNAKAAEASRFALEIFLKTFLAAKTGVSEKEIKALGHDLDKLLRRCLALDPQSELRYIESKLSLYPDVAARYRAEGLKPRDLWVTYNTALIAGAVVMRPLSGRDMTRTIQIPAF
jgi:hypothetical protein